MPSPFTNAYKWSTIIERRTRNKPETPLSSLSTVMFELPLIVLFLLLWFICAHTGIAEFFGPFRHCNLGQGVGVVAAGLNVPSHCKVVAVVHGSSWLTCFTCKPILIQVSGSWILLKIGNSFDPHRIYCSFLSARAPATRKKYVQSSTLRVDCYRSSTVGQWEGILVSDSAKYREVIVYFLTLVNPDPFLSSVDTRSCK